MWQPPPLAASFGDPLPHLEPVAVMVCYARRDKALFTQLQDVLKILEKHRYVRSWCDREIEAGEAWQDEIGEHIESASIILLLLSHPFLASDNCENETAQALEQHRLGRARVIPVVLEPIDLLDERLTSLDVLPTDGLNNPIVGGRWRTRAAVFQNISVGIRKVVDRLRGHDATAPPQPRRANTRSVVPPGLLRENDERAARNRVASIEATLTAEEYDVLRRMRSEAPRFHNDAATAGVTLATSGLAARDPRAAIVDAADRLGSFARRRIPVMRQQEGIDGCVSRPRSRREPVAAGWRVVGREVCRDRGIHP
jgi:hypothetical protein